MVKYEGSYGNTLQITAGSDAYAKGDFWAKGGLAGICADDIPADSEGTVIMKGVVKGVPKTANTVVLAVGDKLYCEDNANSVNKTASSRIAVGYALSASGNGVANVDVYLAPGVG